MLPFIEWDATEDLNIRVKNETDYMYRFFDATLHTEFLYSCVEQTIENNSRYARKDNKFALSFFTAE